MKRSLKRTMAVIIALCCSLAGGTMAYAAEGDSEWGVIPDGYVLFVPSVQSTVIAETAPDSGRETQKTPPASQTDKLPEGSDSSENISPSPDMRLWKAAARTLWRSSPLPILPRLTAFGRRMGCRPW